MWEAGRVVSKGGVVDLVDENTEESDGLLTRVGLELRLDIDDESRSNGGEQTSLLPLLARTYKNLTQNLRR